MKTRVSEETRSRLHNSGKQSVDEANEESEESFSQICRPNESKPS